MAFSKTFPKEVPGSRYPDWEEVYLSAEEESGQDELARKDNIKLMKECISDAKELFSDSGLKDYQTDVINTAIALFEKRSSHAVYWKERKAKEKFDEKHK